MVTTQILSNCLFDEFKPPFKAKDFQEEILTPEVQQAIFIAHQKAFQNALVYNGIVSYITCAGITHDSTHYYLEQELSSLGFEFFSDSSGNSRAFFSKGNYIFILKKKDAPSNPTAISKNLREQNVAKHVITVSYETDDLRTEITRVYVQYLQGNHVEYNFTITPEDVWRLDIRRSVQQPEVAEHKKPRLKIKKQDAI